MQQRTFSSAQTVRERGKSGANREKERERRRTNGKKGGDGGASLFIRSLFLFALAKLKLARCEFASHSN
jgi:hypothetical protein